MIEKSISIVDGKEYSVFAVSHEFRYTFDVQIRATDRDKNSGWYAVIDQIVPSRVRLELPEDIDLNRLANNATIRANVTVEYDLKQNGSRKPKKNHPHISLY